MTKIFVLTYFVATLCVIDTARILGVFPSPSVSHQVVFRVLIKELVRRGHEVVTITTDPAFPKGQAPANLTEIDVHDISYNFMRDMLSELITEYEFGKETPWINLEKITNNFFNVMEVQVKSEPVKKLIQENRQFDILLIEAYMRPAIAYTYLFKAPVILVSSFGATLENLEVSGAPTHPILYPIPYRQRLFNLSLWDKLREYYYHAQYMHLQKSYARFDNDLAQRMFGPNVPPISELNKNVDMLFLNVHPIWMNNQPVPPNIVFMGGLHQKPIKELPKDLKTYLDSSKNGVVYVSFGTNVQPKMFPSERLKIITETFSELPYDILFKWNDDNLPGRTENIKISKWLPQSDLLRHPKVKAFIMQGGLQSTDEAITAGVPLVCIPMFGDQWYNAEKYVQLEIGLKLDLLKLTTTELKNAIETVISNSRYSRYVPILVRRYFDPVAWIVVTAQPRSMELGRNIGVPKYISYRENIVKLRDRMNDQPQSPLERAVWWVEYVLRHGGAKHLRAPAANRSWAEYYELELVSVVLACLLISISIVLFIIVRLWRFITHFLGKNLKVKKS